VNRETSLYLDVIRFLAAIAVFLDHVSAQRLTGGLFWQAGPFGPEAVLVFFVLSGFVIGYVTDTRERRPAGYVIARTARIYSVALPALIVTFVLDGLGLVARPDLYSEAWGYQPDGRVWQFFTGLTFTNQLWSLDVHQGSNLSYWSLGYEVPYYIIFGIALFAAPRWRLAGILAVLVVVGPRIASLFPLWLLGVAAYYICARYPIPRRGGMVLCFGAAAAWIGYEALAWRARGSIGVHPRLMGLPTLLDAYLVASLFALHLIGFQAVSPLVAPVLKRFARPIRWTAGATFSLYLFHMPVAQFIASVVPWAPSSTLTRLLVFGGTIAIVFLLAELTERRKEIWRACFEMLFRQATIGWHRVRSAG
jgi:peptidoglycan/LPS O-acetylase OafA/YrhL